MGNGEVERFQGARLHGRDGIQIFGVEGTRVQRAFLKRGIVKPVHPIHLNRLYTSKLISPGVSPNVMPLDLGIHLKILIELKV